MTDAGPLLVPIRLDAFALVSGSGQTIRRAQMDYTRTRYYLSPEPDPFAGEIDQSEDELGVYLMWTLPAALRHGTQQGAGSGAIGFPWVPNRWLVVRELTPRSGSPTTTAWIVESDYCAPDGTSAYVDTTAKRPAATQLGRKRLLSAGAPWTEPDPPGKPPILSAVAPGNPAFAAFQPDNEDVFSIHDKLADAAGGTLDYFVAGWYAGAGDPLSDWKGAAYADPLKSLIWGAADPEDRTATRSIYHGLLLGVEWDRDGAPPPSARDDVKPRLALGNTSTEALVAFLKAGDSPLGDSDAELLEAFTLDLLGVLDRPGGEEILQRNLHSARFASRTGGYVWDIVDAPTAPGERPHDPPDDDERKLEQDVLAKLNADQQELDGKRRQLASLQRELYELWWKRGFAKVPPGVPSAPADALFKAALDPTQPDSLAATVQGLLDDIDGLQGTLPDPAAAPNWKWADDQKLPRTRLLTASLAPRFYEPADPVLLVGGLGHGLVMDPAAGLACRYTDGVLTEVGDGADLHRAADVRLPSLAATGLPPAISPLLTEFELLRGFCASDRDGFAGRIAKATRKGTLPDLPLEPWRQAWLPLYLEWTAAWRGLPFGSQWEFDGHDFGFRGTPASAPAGSLSGRALLTPGLAYAVKSRLEQRIESDPSLQALEDEVGQISTNWDFLSQTLDGLTTLLAWRDPAAGRAPDDTLGKLVGENYGMAPHFHPGATFEGMRAGRLWLTRISIVDRFGQTLDLLGRGARVPVTPAIAASLAPGSAADAGVAELPPRLLQGARLRMSAGHTAGSLCGFVVPDHIDHALAAYDASGARLGELRLVATDGDQREVVWDPAPRDPGATLDTLEADVAAMLRAVSAAGPGAFENFLTTIDETLWTIDPLAGDQDDELTALAGRPLAVVEAELAFELDGTPLRDPSWEQTFAAPPADPPFLRHSFPVQLGAPADREDGLVGYFCDGDYSRFRAVRVPEDDVLVADPTGYVAAATSRDVTLGFDGSSARVTLLVDPRGVVQAHTGLLPTTALSLPRTSLAPALAAMAVAFRAGPLLALQPPPGSRPVPLMPAPTTSGRSWSWVEQGAEAVAFPAVDDRARFSTFTPTAREGFVQVDPTGGQRR